MNAWVASLTYPDKCANDPQKWPGDYIGCRSDPAMLCKRISGKSSCRLKTGINTPCYRLKDWLRGETFSLHLHPCSASGLKISLFKSNERGTPLLSTWALCIAQGKTTFCDILGQAVVRKYEFRLAHPVTPATASDTWASQLHPSGPTSRVGHSDYAVSIRHALRQICA